MKYALSFSKENEGEQYYTLVCHVRGGKGSLSMRVESDFTTGVSESTAKLCMYTAMKEMIGWQIWNWEWEGQWVHPILIGGDSTVSPMPHWSGCTFERRRW
jgi:hypothetical protein